jgi:threonylcarbamoyladenosine tRNA methylthiotransferase MtaB
MTVTKKIAFKTLGCRLNQFETGSLATQFKDAGYQLVGFNEIADAYVVNTCTVTNQSDHKSRNIISQAGRKSDGAVVVVTGCMAESSKQKLQQDDRITYVVGNNSKSDIFSVLDAHFKGEIFQIPETRKVFDYTNPGKIYKTRGTLKIQDGCDNFCTFCIIPFVRGRAISRPLDDILDDARGLIGKGYHEIVVTGVNIGRYNHNNKKFEDVVEQLLELPGDFRLRISSMEPEGIGEKFIHLLDHPKMCPHLHLCLQSGSDRILLKMRRMYDMGTYRGIVDKIKGIRPDFHFTTDILVGFPGETDEDFLDTVKSIESIGFGHIHTFKYSLRDGTRAARMEAQISEKLKTERARIIRELAENMKQNIRQKMIGMQQTVLVEKVSKENVATGYGEHYMPVKFTGNLQMKDTFQRVLIIGTDSTDQFSLLARPLA